MWLCTADAGRSADFCWFTPAAANWERLRAVTAERQVRVVALDLPISRMLAVPADEFTARMFAVINGMMLDVLAAVARKDYDDRRRQA